MRHRHKFTMMAVSPLPVGVPMFLEYKFGSGHYFQQKGALSAIGAETELYGKCAYVFSGKKAFSIAGDSIKNSLTASNVKYKVEIYDGFPTLKKIEQMATQLKNVNADVIIGVGGGRIIDAAKAAAEAVSLPVITVPTTAATCAAYTPISLCYTDDGRFDKTLWLKNEVASVIADPDILSTAPPRYLAAGMLDAMAKYVEIANGTPVLEFETTPVDRHSAYFIAKYIFDTLKKHAPMALFDACAKARTKLLDDVFFINIALTGIVSGITRGKGQTAVAHAFYNGVRKLFCEESRLFLHGEIVAIGLLAQYAYNGQPELAFEMRDFMRTLHTPTSISEIGIAETEKNFSDLFEFMKTARFMQSTDADEAKLRKALEFTRKGWGL